MNTEENILDRIRSRVYDHSVYLGRKSEDKVLVLKGIVSEAMLHRIDAALVVGAQNSDFVFANEMEEVSNEITFINSDLKAIKYKIPFLADLEFIVGNTIDKDMPDWEEAIYYKYLNDVVAFLDYVPLTLNALLEQQAIEMREGMKIGLDRMDIEIKQRVVLLQKQSRGEVVHQACESEVCEFLTELTTSGIENKVDGMPKRFTKQDALKLLVEELLSEQGEGLFYFVDEPCITGGNAYTAEGIVSAEGIYCFAIVPNAKFRDKYKSLLESYGIK